MANTSILAAFERMRQHIVTALAKKSDVGHIHSNATQSTSGFLSAEDKTQLDNGGIPIVAATSSDGVSYTATVDGISTLTVGMKITIIPNMNSANVNVKLNLNGFGDKYIRMPIAYNSTATSAGALASWIGRNKPITLEYDGTYFKTISMPRPSALYLYGTVPVTGGGTGLNSITTNSFVVGNGTSAMVEKTPVEVLSMINGASVATITTAEYTALEEAEATNANTLYMLTDAEEEYYTMSEIDTKVSDINKTINTKQDALAWVTDDDVAAMFNGTYVGV